MVKIRFIQKRRKKNCIGLLYSVTLHGKEREGTYEDKYLAAVKNPISKEVVASYQKRMDAILEKLAGNRS